MDGAKEALPTSDLFPFRYHFLRFTMKEVGQDKDIMDNEREENYGHGNEREALWTWATLARA